MADIALVIKLPEELYETYKGRQPMLGDTGIDMIARSIANGIPIPKKHGRIGDLDSIMNDICNSINEMTNIGISVDGQYLWAKLNDAVDNASTIIPADAESEE